MYPTAGRKTLVVWDMERQQPLGQLEGHEEKIKAVAARGSLAVSCMGSSVIRARVWNLETMRCTATLPRGLNHSETSSACCMDGRVILGQWDGVFKVWDIAASTPIALAAWGEHSSAARDVKAEAAGNMVLTGSDDKMVRLWDLRTRDGRAVRTMMGHSLGVRSVDLDGHCRTAVSGSDDRTVKRWDLGSGDCLGTYEGHGNCPGVLDVVMHESGSSFLSCGRSYNNDGPSSTVNAWAVGSSEAIMEADMAVSACMPDSSTNRLFASRDLSTVAFCSINDYELELCVWR